MKVSGHLQAQAALPPRGRARGTHWIGGWMGPGSGLEAVVTVLGNLTSFIPAHESERVKDHLSSIFGGLFCD
jgi:hypothetical protein